MKKVKLNLSELELIVQTLIIPLYAFGRAHFLEDIKISEKEIVAMLDNFKRHINENSEYEVEDKYFSNIIIAALLSAYEIAGNEYQTITGYYEQEFVKVIKKLNDFR